MSVNSSSDNNTPPAHPLKYLTPKSTAKGEAVFDEAWQAEALAMADLLIQAGLISATEWAATLGANLQQLQRDESDTIESYYQGVLAALEQVLTTNELLAEPAIQQREEDWKTAYRTTPHGKPVTLVRSV